MLFKNRQDAGQKLAQVLISYKDNPDVIIIALPRGGVVIGYEIAQVLKVPLDIIVPRKIGAPGNPEFAIGAITQDGEGSFDESVIRMYGITQEYIDGEVEKEKEEAFRRLKLYRGDRAPLKLKDKIVILTDDGIATGNTMKAAITSLQKQHVQKLVVAVPVSAKNSLRKIEKEVDEVVCLHAPVVFRAVGAFYENFEQTEDEGVIKLMRKIDNR